MTPTVAAEERARGRVAHPGVPMAVIGPTASGKTEASVELARRLDAEIVVVDSMTVYRGMDVGTAKPGPEERRAVPHHLLDVAEPTEPFSVARFQELARAALRGIAARGRHGVLVGGSGLYFRAVVDDLRFPGTDPAIRRALEAEAAVLGPERLHARLAGVDPRAAGKIDPANARRTVRALEVAALTGQPFSSFGQGWERYPPDRVWAVGIAVEPPALERRIRRRVRRMWEGGLLDEARALLERGSGPFITASQAIGYVEAAEHLRGAITAEEAMTVAVRRTRALARRQMAWFRRDPRIRWLPAGEDGAAAIVDRIEEALRA